MGEIYQKFIKDSAKKAFDLEHRFKINYNIGKYNEAVIKGKDQFKDIELARERAAALKHRIVNNLEIYLVEFAANFEKNGGKIIWAQNAEEATQEILSLMRKKEAKNVVKSKSMITEEIELNEVLEQNDIEIVETDLWEYIVQISE